MAMDKVNNYSQVDSNILELQLTTDKAYKSQHTLTLTNYDNTTVPAIAAGSVIEVNGTMYKADSEEAISTTDPVTSSTVADGTVYVVIVPDTTTATAAFTATAPTWSDSKQGWYGTGGQANYRYCEYTMTKATSSYKKWAGIKEEIAQTLITASGTWTAPKTKWYDVWITARGGNGGFANPTTGGNYYTLASGGGGGATGYKRIWIAAGTEWTATLNTGSGANTEFTDGTTTLSVQNGYVGGDITGSGSSYSSNHNPGAGGSASSGMDLTIPGGCGGCPVSETDGYGLTLSGHGGASFLCGQTKGIYNSRAAGNNAAGYGGGGSGASNYASTTKVYGGTGGGALIRII